MLHTVYQLFWQPEAGGGGEKKKKNLCVYNLRTYESQDVNNHSRTPQLGWCGEGREKKKKKNCATASLLPFLLSSPFPPPFIQEGLFP